MKRPNTDRSVRHFRIGGIEVRYVPRANGARLECTACKAHPCQHTENVSAWFTLHEATNPTENPAELRRGIVAIRRHDSRSSFGAIPPAARLVEISENDPRATEEPARPLDLGDRIMRVIQHAQASSTDYLILSDIAVGGPVERDPECVEEVLGTLITSAVTEEFTPGAVIVKAYRTAGELVIRVSNGGQVVPGAKRNEVMRSFKGDIEFVGGKIKVKRPLDTCAEIARANGGELVVSTENGQPCFTFRMPIASM